MGIHYDYKSTRGEKAMKKEAKRKARLEERRAKRMSGRICNFYDFGSIRYIKCSFSSKGSKY